MQDAVKHTWYFNRAPQEVWEWLTRPELLEQWLMKTDFQPIVGHQFRFDSGKDNHCEVLEVRPYTKLSYSWRVPSVLDGKPFSSKVEWTLTPKGSGTELQLVHNGFTTLEDYFGHKDGWKTLGDDLAKRLNS